jgi:uncharacterized protein YbcV (DUF1398 family)
MSIKVKILEFEQLNWVPEDDVTIDRHHSILSTYWLVEINHKKCIFFYMDVNFFDAENWRGCAWQISIRPDPNFSKIWSDHIEPDYNSEDRMARQDTDEFLSASDSTCVQNWYNNCEEKTETYIAHEDYENCTEEERVAYRDMYEQISAIYEKIEPCSDIKSIDDLEETEFEIKV